MRLWSLLWISAALASSEVAAAQTNEPILREQPYHGGPLPPGTHLEVRSHDQFFQDAILSTLSLWVINIWVAGLADVGCIGCTDHSYDWLYLPLAGPAIAAAMPGVARAGEPWQVILVADSVFQVSAGIVALVAYFFRHERVVVPNTGVSRWTISPGPGGAPLGLTFTLHGF